MFFYPVFTVKCAEIYFVTIVLNAVRFLIIRICLLTIILKREKEREMNIQCCKGSGFLLIVGAQMSKMKL